MPSSRTIWPASHSLVLSLLCLQAVILPGITTAVSCTLQSGSLSLSLPLIIFSFPFPAFPFPSLYFVLFSLQNNFHLFPKKKKKKKEENSVLVCATILSTSGLVPIVGTYRQSRPLTF